MTTNVSPTQALSGVELNRFYLISGRIAGDDDDSVHIVEAPDMGTAESLFTTQLREESFVGEEARVFIVHSISLAEAIKQRVGQINHTES
jgi:hypothetical protein|tara:strand:- start:649 stop:918 length:270 start_codon:yes stop_codon:yes gene_type:complete